MELFNFINCFNYSSVEMIFGSTIIRPQCSQTKIFLFILISNCFCGGILLKQPPQESRSTGTTARPLRVFERTLLYAFTKRSSIASPAYSDAFTNSFSSFSVSVIISSNSDFFNFKSFFLSEKSI